MYHDAQREAMDYEINAQFDSVSEAFGDTALTEETERDFCQEDLPGFIGPLVAGDRGR